MPVCACVCVFVSFSQFHHLAFTALVTFVCLLLLLLLLLLLILLLLLHLQLQLSSQTDRQKESQAKAKTWRHMRKVCLRLVGTLGYRLRVSGRFYFDMANDYWRKVRFVCFARLICARGCDQWQRDLWQHIKMRLQLQPHCHKCLMKQLAMETRIECA